MKLETKTENDLNLERIERIKQKVLFLNKQVEQWILPSSYILDNLIKENKKLLLNIKQEQELIKKQQKKTKKQEYKAHLTALYSRLNLYEKNIKNNLVKLNKFLELVDSNSKNQWDNSNLIDIYDIDKDKKIDIEEINLLHKNINFLKKQDENLLKIFSKFQKPKFTNIDLIEFISIFKEYDIYSLNSQDLIKLFSDCKDNLKEFYFWKNTIDEIRKENETIVYKIKKIKEIKQKWEKYNNLVLEFKQDKISLWKLDINNFSLNDLFLNICKWSEKNNKLFLENLKTLWKYNQAIQDYKNLIEKIKENITILNSFWKKNYLQNEFLEYKVDLSKFINLWNLKTLDKLQNINKSLENIKNKQDNLIDIYTKYFRFLNKFWFRKEETKQVSNKINLDNIINKYNSIINQYKQVENINKKLWKYWQSLKQINIDRNDLLNWNFNKKINEYKKYLAEKKQELNKILKLKNKQNNLISKIDNLKNDISYHWWYSSKGYNLTNDLIKNIAILGWVVSYLDNKLEEAIEEERRREEERRKVEEERRREEKRKNSYYNNSSSWFDFWSSSNDSWSDSSDSFWSDSSWTSSGEDSW